MAMEGTQSNRFAMAAYFPFREIVWELVVGFRAVSVTHGFMISQRLRLGSERF